MRGEIRVLQSKTLNPVVLPLTQDVGEALKDYIRYVKSLGFQIDTYYPPEKVQEHYFQNREDGLRAWENVCLLSATFTSGRAYE